MTTTGLSAQVGRVVGGRYRIVAPVGMGASAQVFLAEDTTLGRQVALKMLQPALAGDARFLEHFRAEARVVASVSHPNIVVVHDSGVDGVPYLVTEYLAGGSLFAMLRAGHRLSPSQALAVGLDLTRGLAHAHARGLVHRDLKPANLVFGEDGRLRIADFGIARALAETGMTEHDGSLVGTVRYAAPEQARGEPVGSAADVYAAALVVVESVTGELPFPSSTVAATLAARIDADLAVPPELGPLRGPLERAGRADPDERSDAEELAIGLLAVAEQLPAPDPLPLVGATAADTDGPSPDPTTHAVRPAPAGVGAADPAEVPSEAMAVDPDVPGRGRRRRVLVSVLVAVVAFVATVGAVWALWGRPAMHEVPAVVGEQIEVLRAAAVENDWTLDERRTRSDGTEPGEIVDLHPAAGERLREGGVLEVWVSEGNELTDLPGELAGRPLADVVAALEAARLEHETRDVHHEEVPVGHVVGTDGEVDARLPRGSVVALLVSLGPEPRTVPSFEGDVTYDTVAAALAELGLVAERSDVFDDDAAAGVVLGTVPPPGTEVPRDSTVVVEVSRGPDLVEVPDMRGMNLGQAERALDEAGLVLGQDCCTSRGQVVGSDPSAGAMVRRGSSVNLFLAR